MKILILLALAVWTGVRSSADTIRLRNGDSIDGMILGGDARYLKVLETGGTPRSLLLRDVESIEVKDPEPPRTEENSNAVPAGTAVAVRTIDLIDSDAATAGHRYRASVDEAVTVDGTVAIPKGADAMLELASVNRSGAFTGSDRLSIRLLEVKSGGPARTVTSSYARVDSARPKGKLTAIKTMAMGVAGAGIGALMGGGTGALIGAGIGGVSGLAVSAATGKSVKVEPETRLVFVLREPLALEGDKQ